MIKHGSYVFRTGKTQDRSAPRYIPIPKRPPEFILEYDYVQIGAAHGDVCRITQIEIFDDCAKRGIGHGTKFIELWEEYVKGKCEKITVSPVTVPDLAHILGNKRGFKLIHEDESGGKTFEKILT